MTNVLPMLVGIVAGFAAGAALGVVFFGGLWWTAQRLLMSPRPGLLALASLVVRSCVLGGGLLLVARCGIAAVVAAAGGTLLVRQLMIRHVSVGMARGQ